MNKHFLPQVNYSFIIFNLESPWIMDRVVEILAGSLKKQDQMAEILKGKAQKLSRQSEIV